jgi:hypothetical protein
MEYPNYNLSNAYSEVILAVYATSFLAPLVPLVIFYSLFGLICFYWVEKYLLINKRSVRNTISYELTKEMIELLELSL